MLLRFGTCASYNFDPFDSTVYKTIERELMTLPVNFLWKFRQSVATHRCRAQSSFLLTSGQEANDPGKFHFGPPVELRMPSRQTGQSSR